MTTAAIKIAAPHSRTRKRPVAARPRKKPDTTRYEGRVAQRISDLMEQRGMSAADLASRIGVEPPAIWHWLSNRRSIPLDMLPAIAKALKTTVAELLPGK